MAFSARRRQWPFLIGAAAIAKPLQPEMATAAPCEKPARQLTYGVSLKEKSLNDEKKCASVQGTVTTAKKFKACGLTTGGVSMSESMKVRINKMYRGDIIFAWGFVIALWCSVIFVFYSIDEGITDGTLSIVLRISGALVLLFNTASILAMVRQYSRERDFIYGLDIRHLDQMRAAQGK